MGYELLKVTVQAVMNDHEAVLAMVAFARKVVNPLYSFLCGWQYFWYLFMIIMLDFYLFLCAQMHFIHWFGKYSFLVFNFTIYAKNCALP